MTPSTNESPSSSPTWAWLDGEFVRWDDCVLHVRTQALMTGASVFEGIRAYWDDSSEELYIFKLNEHLRRMEESAKIMRMRPFNVSTLRSACIELLSRNEFREDVHIIPVAYVGFTADLNALGASCADGVFITAVPRPKSKGIQVGVRVGVSSWRRIADSAMPPRVKAAANYQNSRMAFAEARQNGYENAILLNDRGTVAEGPGACVMIVRHGTVVTPPVTAGILESLTRSTLLSLIKSELDVPAVEREVDRTELYVADEAYYCGTGHEITPIINVDGISIGNGEPGPLTRSLQDLYFAIARGRDERYSNCVTPVYQPVETADVSLPAGSRIVMGSPPTSQS